MAKMKTLEEQGLDISTLEKLTAKGVLMIAEEDAEGKLCQATTGVMIDAPPDEVWGVVTDYDHYHDFMPQTKKVKVRKQSGNVSEVEYHLKLSIAVVGIGIDYTLRQEHEKPRRITFERIAGDLENVYGGWEFIPVAGGEKTLAFYSIFFDLKSLGRVASFALKQEPSMELVINVSGAVLVVKALKDRVEKYI